MNKKLTTIMLAVLLLLIGKVDAATLTQYVGEHYISQTVNEGQTVRLRFINQSNYTFTNWTVESGNVTIDTTNPTITFTMPNSDVVIRGNYAEESASLLSDVATVGAYVTYVPSSTSYTVPATVSGADSNQTYIPSSTTSWRVFSNDGENVEIISADSVRYLGLYGVKGFINAVQTLNDLSASYVNSTYAISGRSLGYSLDGLTDIANYKVINTYPLTSSMNTDSQYNEDVAKLASHGSMYHMDDEDGNGVWLASRSTYGDASTMICVSNISSSGDIAQSLLADAYSDGESDASGDYNSVRPVISLKSDLTVTGGTGTADDPYIINESNPSQYTVTYCANGGYGEMNPQSVAQGSSLTLSTNAYAHHSATFLGWATSATATTATYTDGQSITPTADMTLYAIWEKASYTITVTQATGGTISPSTTTVEAGGNQTFTITPDSGYNIKSIIVDGESVAEEYTSTFVTDDVFTVTGSGSYPWAVDGSVFASSNGAVASSTSTSTITMSGTGTLSFDYSVSSESNYDKLTITVADDSGTTTVANAISGTNSGNYESEVTGDITITLTYTKDGSQNTNDDRGTISSLVFKNTLADTYEFSNVTSNHTITAEFAEAGCSHSYTAQSTSSTYLRSAATCTDDATYYYKCANCTEYTTSSYWTDSGTSGHDTYISTYDDAGHTINCYNCTYSEVDTHYYYNGGDCTCGRACDHPTGTVTYQVNANNLYVEWNWSSVGGDSIDVKAMWIQDGSKITSSDFSGSGTTICTSDGRSIEITIDYTDKYGGSSRWMNFFSVSDDDSGTLSF